MLCSIKRENMVFKELEKINHKPIPYEFYTAEFLWNDKYISKKMLEYHLNGNVDPASRKKAFIDKSVTWIVSRFNVGPKTKICDFGCGPGLYTIQLAENGANVTGVDFSERSIQYAKSIASQKNIKINYLLQNYLQFESTVKYDLITLIYEDLCTLSPKQRKTLFKIFYKSLKENGAILLDVLSENHYNTTNEKTTYEYSPGNGFWAPDPYYVFLNTLKYEKEKVILDKYTLFGETFAKEVYNWLQCYSYDSLRKELEDNGFRIVEHYSDVSGTPYSKDSKDIAIVAKRII